MLRQDNRMEEKMITKYKNNPIIKPGDVKPSHETSYPDIVEFKSSDPEVILKDTCANHIYRAGISFHYELYKISQK